MYICVMDVSVERMERNNLNMARMYISVLCCCEMMRCITYPRRIKGLACGDKVRYPTVHVSAPVRSPLTKAAKRKIPGQDSNATRLLVMN